MKKKVAGTTLVSTLLFSATTLLSANSATADPYVPEYIPYITINSDGTVTPQGYMKQAGNVYTLTADIEEYAIRIERSNIIFDGAGHTVNTTKGDNYSIDLDGVANVTVKNLNIHSRFDSIRLASCSNCLITNIQANKDIYLSSSSQFNTVTRCKCKISLFWSANNTITKNKITHLFVGSNYKNDVLEVFFRSVFNIFSQNNIYEVEGVGATTFWDNGTIGNYWSDYQTKYPNASEIGYTGIGDTPYTINEKNIDLFPLMYPYDTEKDAITLPERSPPPDPETTPFPTTLVAALVASIAVVGVGLLVVSFKKRHEKRVTNYCKQLFQKT